MSRLTICVVAKPPSGEANGRGYRGLFLAVGNYLLDPRAGVLFRDQDDGAKTVVVIGSRALAVLLALIDHVGEVVSKRTLMDAVWPNMAVEESNLTVQISALRRALDFDRGEASLIQTVAGRG
jgi:DNA-binding winged helix-turn-helix (wHTH) protein